MHPSSFAKLPKILSDSLYIHGYGSVSPAGFDSKALYAACTSTETLPVEALERMVGEELISYPVRRVDTKALRSHIPKHPRLRRASGVTKFAVAAAHQAIGEERLEKIKNREFTLGIVVSFMNGCVNYSNKFFGEVLNDPSFASPILFPETVFNAPASHVASHLDSDGPAYTLIGDSATWFSAIRVADDWLSSGQVDGCLVLSAEEIDWLTSEGLYLYSKKLIACEGASAIYLESNPSDIQIEKLIGPLNYTNRNERKEAIAKAWSIEKNSSTSILVNGLSSVNKIDQDELAAIGNWQGENLSPLTKIGDGMGTRCGFQTIIALEALQHGYDTSIVLASGGNQHAFSAKFLKT